MGMKELEYPLDGEWIFKKKKTIRKTLLEKGTLDFITKKVAVLGGSTTHDILLCLELFLLNYKIIPVFYESEYAKYWEDVMFLNEELVQFEPDIIYIHTTNRNLLQYPKPSDSKEQIDILLEEQYHHFSSLWDKITLNFHCIIIQNNFELPGYRLLGNQDASDFHGRSNFITRLNLKLYEYAQQNEDFYINDIHYLSSVVGLDQWLDQKCWFMYKYALSLKSIPYLAHNVATVIKAIYGKNKKVLVLDLDQTLWGGIIGEDGVENIQIGEEDPVGQAYSEFQKYIKAHKELGVLLTISSKNDYENAMAGLNHQDGILRPDDFIQIKANWEPKSDNIMELSKELNLGLDSFVFVDDNPAEREIVTSQLPETAVPEVDVVENYIRVLDRNGYFEMVHLSSDDLKRSQMYQENLSRGKQQQLFRDYSEYLQSLEMKAEIKPFSAMYLARIAQLTNKSNQFNLTTKRFSIAEIEAISSSKVYLHWYGRLEDKFGDNGVVTVVIGRIEKEKLHLELWLMSCRVLKRDLEIAMLDEIIAACKNLEIYELVGYYYKTDKNAMVKEFYGTNGFTMLSENKQGDSIWSLTLDGYQYKNKVIKVNENE